jgi:hypothetical protein
MALLTRWWPMRCRWAVWQAASLLRRYKAEHTALMEAMQRGAPVAECVKVVEGVN